MPGATLLEIESAPLSEDEDAQKIGEDRTCSSEDMIADRQTHTHTDRQTDMHAHHNTPLPYRGRSN